MMFLGLNQRVRQAQPRDHADTGDIVPAQDLSETVYWECQRKVPGIRSAEP